MPCCHNSTQLNMLDDGTVVRVLAALIKRQIPHSRMRVTYGAGGIIHPDDDPVFVLQACMPSYQSTEA